MTAEENVRARILALILPRRAQTEQELDAVEGAVRAQIEYETALPEGVTRQNQSNDGVRVEAARARPAFGLCDGAKARLKLAGLITSGIPAAKPF